MTMTRRGIQSFFSLADADGLQRLLIAVVCLLLGLHVYVIFFAKVNHDEVEHLLVAYRMLGGESPYLDFDQNHLPFYWFVLIPLVKVFSHSVVPLYLGRLLSFGWFLAAFWFGTRLLEHAEGDRRHNCGFLFLVMSVLYFEMEMFRIRPEGLMTLLASAGFFVMARSHRWDFKKSGLVGLLIGLAMAFVPKALLVAGVYPLVLLGYQTPRSLPGLAGNLAAYLAGLGVGLLPVVLFLWVGSAWQEFYLTVFQLNAGLDKAFFQSFRFRHSIGFAFWILAVGFVVARWREYSLHARAVFAAAVLWVLCGYMTLLVAGHSSLYNVQIVLVPLGLCITGLIARLTRGRYRLPVAAALVVIFSFGQVPEILANQLNGGGLYVKDFKQMVSLTRGGDKTCVGFAPVHPVYCKNVLPVSLIWDVVFLKRAGNPEGREYIRGKWERALRNLARVDADIIVDRIPSDVFGVALAATVSDEKIRWEKYRALQAYLDANYDSVLIEQPVDQSLRIRIRKTNR